MSTFLRRIAPLTGVAFSVLILVTFLVGGSSPSSNATGEHVISYYQKHHNAQVAVAFLLAYAAFLGLIWAGSLRSYLRARSDSRSAIVVGFAGFVIFAIGMALFSGLTFALTDHTGKYESAAAQALNILDDDLFVVLLVGLATFMLATGLVIAISGALPKWLGWVALVIGIVSMTPIGWFGLIALIVWSAVVGVWIFIREGKGTSADATGAAAAPATAG